MTGPDEGTALTPSALALLETPEAHPGDPSAKRGVEHVQTHLSHVFLTRDRVYKFRKPVDLGFVCFATRAQRNADCLAEVALNRRLAPDVYLGVAPLCRQPDGIRIGAPAEELFCGEAEHCVVMRRLANGRDALSLLRNGALSGAHLDRLAERIADFHARHGLGAPAPYSPEEWRDRCVGPLQESLEALAPVGSGGAWPDLLRAARESLLGFASRHAERFEERRRRGCAADGHGDLHLQHVWFERSDSEPLVIDCLEFSERLRRIDVASEVAFTAMDLAYRGAARLGERFLRAYARSTDDFHLYSVVDFFIGYRAAVRAKVAAIAACDSGIETDQRKRARESADRHLQLAAEAVRAQRTGVLVLVGGVVGSGKSSAANRLAESAGGVVIASDRVRKRLLGLAPSERVGADWRTGAYTVERTDRVYAELLVRAEPVLRSGRPAVLDATFAARRHRAAARDLARRLGVRAVWIETRCAPQLALARLARREAEARDASDAGPALYAQSAAAFEPADEWPPADALRIHTDRESWGPELDALAAGLTG